MRTLLTFFLLFASANAALAESKQSGFPSSESLLAGTYWWVEDISGRGVVDASHTTIGFMDANSVSGDTSCNRYHGRYSQAGSGLGFGVLAGTRRACHEALMHQEQQLYDALGQVTSWRIEPTGLLFLLGAEGGVLIRASAIQQDDL